MNGICYKNTKTTLPNWVETLHESQPLGYAYETNSHFVHLYGTDNGLNIISVGLTVIESKVGTLEDWVKKVFGAEEIIPLNNEIGHSIDGIWRPSLYYQDDTYKALNVTKFAQRSSEQALRILIEKLDELLLYIEPDVNGLKSYGHKSRELLILACTEVENQWTALLNKAGAVPTNGRTFTTQDYVKLLNVAHLGEYVIKLRNYEHLNGFQPFDSWNTTSPTQSLTWYDAYNKTKHDRDAFFNESTLQNIIQAVTANVVMFCSRFGPFNLLNESKTLSSIINQNFEIYLKDSKQSSYYIPEIELPVDTRKDLFLYDCYRDGHNKSWVVNPLAL